MPPRNRKEARSSYLGKLPILNFFKYVQIGHKLYGAQNSCQSKLGASLSWQLSHKLWYNFYFWVLLSASISLLYLLSQKFYVNQVNIQYIIICTIKIIYLRYFQEVQNGNYNFFIEGRSVTATEPNKHRDKRQANQLPTPTNEPYRRFGKNSNFVRFGRNRFGSGIIIRSHSNMSPIFQRIADNAHDVKLKDLAAEFGRRENEKYFY